MQRAFGWAQRRCDVHGLGSVGSSRSCAPWLGEAGLGFGGGASGLLPEVLGVALLCGAARFPASHRIASLGRLCCAEPRAFPHRGASLGVALLCGAARFPASHRIASHRIASHRIASLRFAGRGSDVRRRALSRIAALRFAGRHRGSRLAGVAARASPRALVSSSGLVREAILGDQLTSPLRLGEVCATWLRCKSRAACG